MVYMPTSFFLMVNVTISSIHGSVMGYRQSPREIVLYHEKHGMCSAPVTAVKIRGENEEVCRKQIILRDRQVSLKSVVYNSSIVVRLLCSKWDEPGTSDFFGIFWG